MILPTPDLRAENEDEYVRATMRRFNLIYKHIKKNTEASFRRNAKLYTGNNKIFKLNSLVWVYSSVKIPNKPSKITDSWVGPYRVISRPAEVLLELKPVHTNGRNIVVHVSRVQLYRGNDQTQLIIHFR